METGPFREIPETGVIFVMSKAREHGYSPGDASWSNLGQGAPEVGDIPGAIPRLQSISLQAEMYEYAPVGGLTELRNAVADLYNERYRGGKKSKYTAENVAISSGGRSALTRLVSCLGKTNIGHYIPDYTAYEELLGTFGTFMPIPIALDPAKSYSQLPEELTRNILNLGLSAVLVSNPSNPTGHTMYGASLNEYIGTAKDLACSLIFDEFYSHYLFAEDRISVSAAEFVDDVDSDEIFIVDGLTKNWRYPGFRVSWTLGPKKIIRSLASAGSFLDGGAAHPMQRAAIGLVNRTTADAEAKAIKEHFKVKRDYMINALSKLGIKTLYTPAGAFYCWCDLSQLPAHVNTGMTFFEACLKEKVIIVPGIFFDINPGHRRPQRQIRFAQYARISFGPSMEELVRGVSGLARVLKGTSSGKT